MIVYIVRHGKAEREAPTGLDRDRVLRPKGRRQSEFLGEQLRSMALPPTAVLTSPYARTVETADIIARVIGVTPLTDDRLVCDAPPSAALDLIAECDSLGVMPCLVGHNPQVSELLRALVGALPEGGASMRTGEMVCLAGDGPEFLGRLRLDRRLRLEEE